MVNRQDIQHILSTYNRNNLTIGVVGSHSALDVCRGAKDEGLNTLVICQKGREKTYGNYYKTRGTRGIVDTVITLDSFDRLLNNDIQMQLREQNVIFVPHRSFEVYLNFAYDKIENDFLVPIFGTRHLLKAEERTQSNNQYDLLQKAGIRIPKIFKTPDEIDRLCLVKIPEKDRPYERSFFCCASPQEFNQIIEQKLKRNEINEKDIPDAVIEEFALGTMVNLNFFYSPTQNQVELLGTDTRRQTNLDGILRLTSQKQGQLEKHISPKYEESGHIAVTVLESMLEKIYTLGEQFVAITKQEYAPGIIGPFALQTAIVPGPPKKDFVVFDVSLRMPGSPGTRYTPYMHYLYGRQISAGQRVAMEIKQAVEKNNLLEVVT